jgi:hypothetical protein
MDKMSDDEEDITFRIPETNNYLCSINEGFIKFAALNVNVDLNSVDRSGKQAHGAGINKQV